MTRPAGPVEHRFKGMAVRSAYEKSWPLNRALLVLGDDELRFARAPRWVAADLRVAHGDRPVHLERHRTIPFVFLDVLWLSEDPRVGFVPWRPWRLRRVLVERGWAVEIETRWWWGVRRKLG